MAATSPPSSSTAITQIQAKKHDVFLNFHGKDVRNNFVSFLHQALDRRAIKTFIDYELQRGEEISPATDCINLQYLLGKITCKSLRTLIFSGCSNLQNIPTISDSMEHLSKLFLDGTAISHLPPSIENLTGLIHLNVINCKKLMSLPNGICKLERLQNLNISGCENLDTKSIGFQLFRLSGFRKLWELDLRYCNLVELPSFIDGLSSLSRLYLCGNNFERLPQSICNLRQLEVLNVKGCKRLQSLPVLPWRLKELNAGGCTSLESMQSFEPLSHKSLRLEAGRQIKQFSMFQHFNFCGCLKINEKNQYDILIEAMIQRVQALANISHNNKVTSKNNFYSWYRVIFPGSEIPPWIAYQAIGGSIWGLIPLDLFNDKFMGFALCVVVSLYELKWTILDILFRGKLTVQGYEVYPFELPLYFDKLQDSIMFQDHVAFAFILPPKSLEDWLKDNGRSFNDF